VFYSYNGTTQRFGSSLFLFHIYNYSTKLRKLALRKTHIKLLSRAFYHTNYFAWNYNQTSSVNSKTVQRTKDCEMMWNTGVNTT